VKPLRSVRRGAVDVGCGTASSGAAFAATATTRRRVLGATAGAWLLLRTRSAAAVSTISLEAAVREWASKLPVREGRVTLEVAPLVENGNAVPITVYVDSPMTTTDRVLEIVVFNERNPQRDVARFTLGSGCARAEVSTRVRLQTSQQLVALARLSDGTQWSHHVNVLVTLAACLES
jgi:sulfur-oxidizing protein SoxY